MTFPALRQRVQTRRCARLPSTRACTRCRLGRVRFFVLLLAWLTWLPVSGPLPHTSHLKAICVLCPLSAKSQVGDTMKTWCPLHGGNGPTYPRIPACQVAETCLRPLSSK